jgi:adenylylsulfate kinase-like enzyme
MQPKILIAGAIGFLGTSWAFSDETVVGAAAPISLFQVPLKCEAVPQIGCGSMSKPILLELEREPAIREAWLNRTGTVLAIVGSDASDHESISKAVESVLEKNGVTVNELAGDAYATGLKSFIAGTDWYRGAEVDALSKIEARAIAQRIVHRVQATVTLVPDKAEALQAGIASAFAHRFIDSPNDTGSKRAQLIQDISTLARANLNLKEITALEAAFAKGVKPLPEDNEDTKSKPATPECCRLPSRS